MSYIEPCKHEVINGEMKIRQENKEKKKRKNGHFFWQKKRRVSVMRGERKEKSRERNFSLRYMEIGSWVFVEVKGKVDPRIASYV